MASLTSLSNGFYFFLFFVYLSCFSFFSNKQEHRKQSKKSKITPLSPSPSINSNSPKPLKSLPTSILSYLSHIFSFKKTNSATKSIPDDDDASPQLITSSNSQIFSNRTDIYPCVSCGEVLSKPQQLEIHNTTKHSLSELHEGDSSRNIVEIIFRGGWKGANNNKHPTVYKILKIHNSPKTVDRFEEYRDHVRFKAARNGGDERVLADGNERLRFYGTTMLCAVEGHGHVGACGNQYCSTCGIVRYGFSGKDVELDGVGTHETSWGAHVSLPEELEREFEYLHVRRTMLVCRVVAGIVAREVNDLADGKDGIFDSVVPVGGRGELLVFNTRAVLPCFVIVYSTV